MSKNLTNITFYSWQSMSPLRFPRCFCNLAQCQGRIYVLGGAWLDSQMDCANFSSVYDVDIYNDISNVWEGVTALRLGRHDAGVAVLGKRALDDGKHKKRRARYFNKVFIALY